jgi:dihydroxynaphthoic acid synthetase
MTTGHKAPSTNDVLYAVDNAVATITINRPERLNAFTPDTVRALTAAVNRAAKDSAVGVIVVTGTGSRAFSAGGDVSVENEDTFTGAAAFDELMKDLYRAFQNSLKPVIARVNGFAIGGGHHLAYMTDFTIASDHSIFGQNGPRVASPAEGWLVSLLWTVVGMKRAKEIWMLCRRYTAAQALEWGLANAVVPEADLDSEVRTWCDELLAMSPTVFKLVKRSFDESVRAIRDSQDAIDFQAEINPEFYSSGEQQEGATAFLEKRQANFAAWR